MVKKKKKKKERRYKYKKNWKKKWQATKDIEEIEKNRILYKN